MAFPLTPPLKPQLAKSATALPTGAEWRYEPKLDGFRAIVFVDGDDVYIQSRGERPLGRYFPELRFPTGRYVLDGEIVIGGVEGSQDFEALQSRLHPAASRVALLADQIPATFVAFDLLADPDPLLDLPFVERRARLERLAAGTLTLTPLVASPADADRWLHDAEGVIAKDANAPYLPGERRGMVKIKRVRTIHCVVVGWRPGKAEGTVGALILGCYEPDGALRVVGHSSGFSAAEKRALPQRLAPYESGAHGSGPPSRWSAGRDLDWVALRPELVVRITFDHTSGGRIRHGAKVVAFDEQIDPRSCSTAQLDR